jgi:hypothetical protein
MGIVGTSTRGGSSELVGCGCMFGVRVRRDGVANPSHHSSSELGGEESCLWARDFSTDSTGFMLSDAGVPKAGSRLVVPGRSDIIHRAVRNRSGSAPLAGA